MRLGKAAIDRLSPMSEAYFVWDGVLKGFGVRVAPSGKKTYWVRYRLGRGRAALQRKRSIGQHGSPWTPDAARAEALRILSAAARGKEADQPSNPRPAVSVSALCDRFLADHVAAKRKTSTRLNYESVIDAYIRPSMGSTSAREVGYNEVARLHADLADKPYQANRCVAVLSKMFNLAERWGIRSPGTNPCKGLDRYKERRRERFLSRVEIKRLLETLSIVDAQSPGWPPTGIIRLLMLTGARRSEIERLEWNEVDLERATIFKKDSKTGQRAIPLNPEAVEILKQLPRQGDGPYVFPAKFGGRHFQGLPKAWREIRNKAGLDDVRIHDLRHTFASLSVAAGVSLPVLGKALGHRSAQTTQRYAHLGDDPVRDAVAITGALIREVSDPEAVKNA